MPQRIEVVHFATNRNLVDEANGIFGNYYNPYGPYEVRYGEARIRVPDNVLDEGGYALDGPPLVAAEAIPGRSAPVGTVPTFGSTRIFDGLRARLMANRSDLLILIHGFGCSFEVALQRAAILKAVYGTPDKPLEAAVFCWPSDGRTFAPSWNAGLGAAYRSDRQDAEASAEAIARSLRRLYAFLHELRQEDRCERRVHLVAHSMGNYVLRFALQSFARDFPRENMPRIFSNILLVASDEDDDAFDTPLKFGRLHEITTQMHLYYAVTDFALWISDNTKGNPDRLGNAGPRTLTNLPRRLNLIDCSDVSDIGGISDADHQFYRARPEVIADIQGVLAGRPAHRFEGREYVSAQRAYRLRPA
ncbi:alpha/beta hydrolase [Pararoseomonas sp. SCSIO 73927]|uniref:alpha/beta hydrolase n=1 Tax=Pararoseomonas sp. SCSIO 73927 TaxID=3114537 RepID=UPI0030D177F9